MTAPSGFGANAAYSVSEALRPESGETLDRVVFATYSLDLITLIGLVMALSGDGESGLEAGPLRLLAALEKVAPRIDVVHQKDRLRPAAQHHHILHLLDGRIHAVQPPPRSSFHPKFALARYLHRDRKPRWRLWIGSRNLTASEDREAGVLLCGRASGSPSKLSGDIAKMASDLLSPVSWVAEHRGELSGLRWSAPDDTKFVSLQWRTAGEQTAFRVGRARSTRILAVSPFVDPAGCGQLFNGTGEQHLLTSVPTAIDLGDVGGVTTYVSAARDLNATHRLVARPEADDELTEPCFAAGLHAKLFLFDAGARGRLFVGSANLTARGFLGRNAEILAEFDVPPETVASLHNFALCHPLAEFKPPDPQVAATKAAARALDQAIAVVLDAVFTLGVDDAGVYLSTPTDLVGFLAQHKLDCWLLTRPDEPVAWVAGTQRVHLSQRPLPLRLHTVLVCFKATPLSGACPPREWAQTVAFPGFDRAARDQAAMADYARLAGASAWLRGQLSGILPTEQGHWASPQASRRRVHGGRDEGDLPLVFEEVLSAWARDPAAFEAKIEPIDAMLAALRSQETEMITDGESDADALRADAEWRQVQHLWACIRNSIDHAQL